MKQLQIKQINTQGQISIGKKFAGQKVQVEEYSDGSVVLTPVEIIPTFELELMKDQMFQKRLLKYDKWVSDNQPVQSNLNQLTK
jgi:hypothetical protein